MSSEDQLDTPETTETDAATATEDAEHELELSAKITDAGPCRKHIAVTISRKDIDHYHKKSIQKLKGEAEVPGFRPGHVPPALIERRFKEELSGQVKQDLLLASLRQITEEHDLEPIGEPELDLESIELPDEGDFVYEFEIEVRPDFQLPDYSGLELERPVREISDEAVEQSLDRYLKQYARLEDHDGPAEVDDYLGAALVARSDGEELRRIDEFYFRIKPTLRFFDAEIKNFDQLAVGKAAGDTIEAETTISAETELLEMRGKKVSLEFTVSAVKRLVLPELNKEFLGRLGLETESELRDALRDSLERQVVYEQRQSTRRQILEKITESATWELPEKLVLEQVENAMRRESLEMRQAGYTTAEVRARESEMRQRAVSETRQALKEHFVLDKIAETEDIQVKPSDVEAEIHLMAMQSGENPRRVRARLTKSGMIENLEAQIRERKAVDIIIERAKFKDVPVARDDSREDVEALRYALCPNDTISAVESDEDDTDNEAD
jgi:trigger factor